MSKDQISLKIRKNNDHEVKFKGNQSLREIQIFCTNDENFQTSSLEEKLLDQSILVMSMIEHVQPQHRLTNCFVKKLHIVD